MCAVKNNLYAFPDFGLDRAIGQKVLFVWIATYLRNYIGYVKLLVCFN